VLAARDHLAHANAGQIGSRQGGHPEFGSGQHAAGKHLVQPLACPPNRISLRHGLIVPWCSKPRASESADSRGSRRRSVKGDGGTTLFRSARSDEDGGFLANIAASEASKSNTARCASSLGNERPHHDGNPGTERSPGLSQGQQFGITELMINAIGLLDGRPRPWLTQRWSVGMATGPDHDQ